MACLTSSYQLLCLQLLLLFYSITSTPLCLLQECSALLQFKHLFSFTNESSFYCDYKEVPSYPKMMSWKEANDCCSWDGVTCDTVTGHVIGLDLSCSWLHGNIPSNASLFLLRHMQSLNLAYNNFSFSKISSDFSQLSSLTLLNLSYSYFEGQIPSEISHLSKLLLLDLSQYFPFNRYSYEIVDPLFLETPVLEGLVRNLTQLRELALDFVNMSTVIPSSLSNLSSSLTSLSLRYCRMQGNFPERIFNLPNLRELALDQVNMSTVIPSSLSNLSSSLTSLSLQGCGMQGNFPEHVFNLPNLQVLDLGWNTNLTGNFPKVNWSSPLKHLDVSSMSLSRPLSDSISNLKSLRYLSLSNCNLFGSIPSSLVNLTQLTCLDLSSNSFVGSIPASLASLIQLTELDLSYNSFNGTIPDVFVNLTQLSYLSLGGNQLDGPIPPLLNELPYLVYINFYNNSFSGTIPSWLFTLPSLKFINLGYNNLTGHIEEFQSNSLQAIYLAGNRLHGSIPSSIFELVNLTTLVLSSNNLSGNLELYMFAKLKKLRELSLSHNRLSVRTTFKANSSLPQLSYLDLSACNISEFPDILRSSSQLDSLDLSENKIQGQIPNWMWDIGRDTLQELNLSHNFLTGIEQQLPWKYLYSLDLRSNLLQGSIPNPQPYIQYLFLSNNKLTGVVPHVICNLSFIDVIDLSNNSLSGNIPKCIGNISNSLRVLDLQRNRLNGSIPNTFGKGNSLETLSFNDNELEGQVPESLVNCRMLEVLDIGNNNINDTFPYWLGNLPNLKALVLRSNKFYGSVWHASKAFNHSFSELRILDLSNNSFSGSLPVRFFENMKAMMNVDEVEKELQYMGDSGGYYQNSVTVTFKGLEIVLVKIITIFTTIDLSNNNFHGEIPEIIGKFHALRLLNLSYNNITGFIPPSLGNLAALESLDLSSNKLVGKIPWQLSRLSFLQILNLSENQLWGPIPTDNHFDTFPTTSYGGNLGLCGFPLPNKCGVDDIQQPPSKLQDDAKSKDGFDWKSVLIGYACGLAFGLSTGHLVFWTGKPQWVVEIVACWIVQICGINMLAKNGRRLNKKREGR